MIFYGCEYDFFMVLNMFFYGENMIYVFFYVENVFCMIFFVVLHVFFYLDGLSEVIWIWFWYGFGMVLVGF